MLKFEEYLSERYKNLIGSSATKEELKDRVYDILQKSYSVIGGLKGAGFSSPDDMVRNVPFWKLKTQNDRILALAMYKDKGGRKRVAIATDGTAEGKEALKSILVEDYSRAYFEISDRSLSFQVKLLGYDFLKRYAKTPKEVMAITGEQIQPPKEHDIEVQRHPELSDYFYQRELGGHMHTKIMFGTTGKKIIEN